jgi:hypothetical protein
MIPSPSSGSPQDLNDAQADLSNGARTFPPAITGGVAFNGNRNVMKTNNAINKDSFGKPWADPDIVSSVPMPSTCCFRERTELLHGIYMFDPATLKPMQVSSSSKYFYFNCKITKANFCKLEIN